jgi:hypothetical protein
VAESVRQMFRLCFFNSSSVAPLCSAHKVFLPNVKHDLIIHFLPLLGRQQFARTAVRLTAFILVS